MSDFSGNDLERKIVFLSGIKTQYAILISALCGLIATLLCVHSFHVVFPFIMSSMVGVMCGILLHIQLFTYDGYETEAVKHISISAIGVLAFVLTSSAFGVLSQSLTSVAVGAIVSAFAYLYKFKHV